MSFLSRREFIGPCPWYGRHEHRQQGQMSVKRKEASQYLCGHLCRFLFPSAVSSPSPALDRESRLEPGCRESGNASYHHQPRNMKLYEALNARHWRCCRKWDKLSQQVPATRPPVPIDMETCSGTVSGSALVVAISSNPAWVRYREHGELQPLKQIYEWFREERLYFNLKGVRTVRFLLSSPTSFKVRTSLHKQSEWLPSKATIL